MKNRRNLLFFPILIFACLNGLSQVPANGLVAFYPFNGNANDESGNGYDAIVSGPVLTTDRCGGLDSAYHFDGVNDYINLLSNFDFPERTINLWFSADIIDDIARHIYISDNPGLLNGFSQIKIMQTNGIKEIRSSAGIGPGTMEAHSEVHENEWHMITLVADEDSVKHYLDGQLIGKFGNSTFASGNGYQFALLGASRVFDRYFKGKIDDVLIYNRTLSSLEIHQLYSITCTIPGLMAFYPFNGNALDESMNDNNGSIYGATLTTDRCGLLNRAYYFDGINDYIIVENSNSLNFSREITLCAWIKPESFTGHGNSAIISKGYYSHVEPYYQYHLGITGSGYPNTPGRFSFCLSINSNYEVLVADSVWNQDEWYFVAGTYDGSFMRIFINGELAIERYQTGLIDIYDEPVCIGRTYRYPGNQYTPGSIDDIRIYNRSLTIEEIQQLYSDKCNVLPDQDLSSYYPFNGNAHDESGNYNHGTVHNAVLTTDRCNVENSAYYFNGYSSYIELPPAVALNTDNSFSIVAWILNDAITSDGKYNDNAIYGQTDGYNGSDFPIIVFEVKEDNTVRSAVRGTGYPSLETRSSTPVNNDEWYQVVLVRNALTDSLSLYINGEFNHGNTAYLNGNTSSNDFVSIGAYYDDLEGMYHYFCGKIDDVMLLNKSLTSEEVRELYQTSDCSMDTADITVEITGEIIVCQNQKDVTYSVPFLNGVSYSWNYSGSGAFIHSYSNSIEVDFSENATSGELRVGVSRPNHEITYATVNIIVKNLPESAQNIAGPVTVCRNDVYYYSTPLIMNAEHYAWNYLGDNAEVLGETDSIRLYFYDHATSGSLMVTGVNQCGYGEPSEHFPIMVRDCGDISSFINIPNSFSPNGDNINDLFIIQGLPENTKVEIFNRNGKLLYKSENYANDWNGYDINGNKLNTDTYWYIISLPGISTEFKGFIYLKK